MSSLLAAGCTRKSVPEETEPSPVVSFGGNAAFEAFCVERFDADGDGLLSQEECDAVRELDCSGKNFFSLEGIRNFRYLETLFCYGNILSDLNLSGLGELKYLYAESSNIHSLDVSGCRSLLLLDVHYNFLPSVDVSDCPAIYLLSVCFNPPLTALDVSCNPRLGVLYCQMCSLEELRLGEKPYLFGLHCWNNALASLDLGGCTALDDLWCGDNDLRELDLRGCPDRMQTVSAPRNPSLQRAFFKKGQSAVSLELPASTSIFYE